MYNKNISTIKSISKIEIKLNLQNKINKILKNKYEKNKKIFN